MSTKQHVQKNNNPETNQLAITIAFSTIVIFIALMLLVHFLRWLLRNCTQDLEVSYQPLPPEWSQTTYNTFAPSSHEQASQDPEARRTLRHERVRDHISGVYQISMSRLRDDDVSLSSDSFSLAEEDEGRCSRANGVDDESSESESSDDSESDSGKDAEVRRILVRSTPVLPRRIVALRSMLK